MKMASKSGDGGKLFDIRPRTADDECAVEARDLFNQSGFDYRVKNFFDKDRENLIGFSSDQTNLRFQDGYGTPTPEVIEESSKIRNEFGWSARGRTPLSARIYQGVPDLSHGVPNPDQESDMFHVKHDITTRLVMESDLSHFDPLIDPIRDTVQSPDHIVPSAWVNGGEDTRGRLREPEYLKRNGFSQDPVTGVWTRG